MKFSIMKEVNYNDNVAGVITWMHTFSPAKMWITGTKLYKNHYLHLATQFMTIFLGKQSIWIT